MSTKNSKYSDLGQRVKKIRKLAELNQQKFGARVGCGGDNISKIEMGLSDPSPAIIKNIAREFNVNEEYLTTGKGNPYAEGRSGQGDAKWQETADEYANLSHQEKEQKAKEMLRQLFATKNDKVLNHLLRQFDLLLEIPEKNRE